ncbi:MAG: hypothetical protein AAF702_16525 [Chloroflexota bacterium]
MTDRQFPPQNEFSNAAQNARDDGIFVASNEQQGRWDGVVSQRESDPKIKTDFFPTAKARPAQSMHQMHKATQQRTEQDEGTTQPRLGQATTVLVKREAADNAHPPTGQEEETTKPTLRQAPRVHVKQKPANPRESASRAEPQERVPQPIGQNQAKPAVAKKIQPQRPNTGANTDPKPDKPAHARSSYVQDKTETDLLHPMLLTVGLYFVVIFLAFWIWRIGPGTSAPISTASEQPAAPEQLTDPEQPTASGKKTPLQAPEHETAQIEADVHGAISPEAPSHTVVVSTPTVPITSVIAPSILTESTPVATAKQGGHNARTVMVTGHGFPENKELIIRLYEVGTGNNLSLGIHVCQLDSHGNFTMTLHLPKQWNNGLLLEDGEYYLVIIAEGLPEFTVTFAYEPPPLQSMSRRSHRYRSDRSFWTKRHNRLLHRFTLSINCLRSIRKMLLDLY